VLLSAACAAVAGCARPRAFNEAVEGTAKLDGRPLAYVRVDFVPQGEPGEKLPTSTGYTDDKGHYRLTCHDGKPGAVVAPYRVVVIQGREDPSVPKLAKPNPPIPTPYWIASQTPLRVEVTPEKHTYDLNLTRPADK
jgi:hypothetical protein